MFVSEQPGAVDAAWLWSCINDQSLHISPAGCMDRLQSPLPLLQVVGPVAFRLLACCNVQMQLIPCLIPAQVCPGMGSRPLSTTQAQQLPLRCFQQHLCCLSHVSPGCRLACMDGGNCNGMSCL